MALTRQELLDWLNSLEGTEAVLTPEGRVVIRNPLWHFRSGQAWLAFDVHLYPRGPSLHVFSDTTSFGPLVQAMNIPAGISHDPPEVRRVSLVDMRVVLRFSNA